MKTELSDLQKLLEVIKEKNLTILDAIKLIQTSECAQDYKEFYLGLDYSQNLQTMIEIAHFDSFDKSINEKRFPFSPELSGKKVEVSVKLVHFNKILTGQEVVDRLSNSYPEFHLGTLAEQLALAKYNPELQKEFPIVALGSVFRNVFGSRSVPVLLFDEYRRCLSLDWFEPKWSSFCRFLIVRN